MKKILITGGSGTVGTAFIKKYYKPSGFYMSRWDNLLKHKNFFKGRVKGVIISPERCIDIDTIEDINHAESTLWYKLRYWYLSYGR